MQIQVNAADAQTRDVDEEMVRNEVLKAMERFASRITRIEVHVKDVNGPKSGDDKQCTMEARLAGLDPMTVTADAPDVRSAVISAAGKLQRKVQSDLEKRGSKR
jgi:ribosome-associated translation inhibitor RaiA